MSRTIRAFLISPALPAILFVLTISVVGLSSKTPTPLPAVIYSAPIWLFFALPISYGLAAIVALPGFLLLRHLGWVSLRRLCLSSTFLGFVVGSIIGVLFNAGAPLGVLATGAVFAIFGVLTGLFFWWLAYRPVT